MRLAAVDVGARETALLIADVEGTHVHEVARHRDRDGEPAEALTSYAQEIAGAGCGAVPVAILQRPGAQPRVRDAEASLAALGARVEIVDARGAADLAFTGATATAGGTPAASALVVDLTETGALVVSHGCDTLVPEPTIGLLELARSRLRSQPPRASELVGFVRDVGSALRESLQEESRVPIDRAIVSVGAYAGFLARLCGSRPHLDVEALERSVDELARGHGGRKAGSDLLAVVCVLRELAHVLRIERLHVTAGGALDGLALRVAGEAGARRTAPAATPGGSSPPTTPANSEADPPPELLRVLGEGPQALPSEVGGKAASLDRLARLGHSVPPGICLTVACQRSYIEANALIDRIQQLTGRIDDPDARAELHELMHSRPLPRSVCEALGSGVALLDRRHAGRQRYAVRSSGIGEDDRDSSMAGIHESYLDVERDRVEHAVRSCWASLWSERSASYRRHRGLTFDSEMAVVIQPLIDAGVSAVVFSRHPLTGAEDTVVMSCTPGLGDAMMAGGDSAVTYTFDRGSHELLDLDIQPGAELVSITDSELRGLLRTVDRVEREYGVPVDVEAVHDGARWLLVQARPITV